MCWWYVPWACPENGLPAGSFIGREERQMRRDGRALDGRPADRPTNFPPLPSSAVAAMLRPVSAYAALCRWYWYPEVAKGPCGAAKNRIIEPCQRISTDRKSTRLNSSH